MPEQTATYERVTAEQIRQHGVCREKHRAEWKLLCGCMTHPKGVSVVKIDCEWYWKRDAAKQEQADE